MNKLFCFGYGYVAQHVAASLDKSQWQIAGTTRGAEKFHKMQLAGIEAYHMHEAKPAEMLADVTHILISIPPAEEGGMVFTEYAKTIQAMPSLQWLGYCSSTAVYGDADGAWVDEQSPTTPTSKRGELRLKAEKQWLQLYHDHQLPVHIFRLSGIYGPGRNAITRLKKGAARRIHKPDHVFSRIHVDDIVQALLLSMQQPRSGAIYNLADDCPAASSDVLEYAADIACLPLPELEEFDNATLHASLKSYYDDCRRVSNETIKSELGLKLAYPSYKEGLKAMLDANKVGGSFL